MDVVDFYLQSWISDDRDGVRRILAADADIEWNLPAPVDDEELVQTLHRVAVFADGEIAFLEHFQDAAPGGIAEGFKEQVQCLYN